MDSDGLGSSMLGYILLGFPGLGIAVVSLLSKTTRLGLAGPGWALGLSKLYIAGLIRERSA